MFCLRVHYIFKSSIEKKSSFDICSLNLNVKMLIKCVYFRGPDSYWSMPCAVNCHWTLWETRRKTYFGLYCLNSYFCTILMCICLNFQLLTYMYQILNNITLSNYVLTHIILVDFQQYYIFARCVILSSFPISLWITWLYKIHTNI